MSTATLTASSREKLGRKVKSLRRDGFVPANIVCHGKESRSIQVEYLPLEKTLNAVGYTQPVQLMLDGEEVIVLVTKVSLVPAKNTLEHVTFQEVKKGELVTANVPIIMTGDAPASQQGLLVLQIMDTLEVQCGALSIPENIEADISSLEEDGDTVKVSDLTVPENVEVQEDPDAGVVKVETPRAVEEPEPEEGEGEEGAEGEEGEASDAEGGSDDSDEKSDE